MVVLSNRHNGPGFEREILILAFHDVDKRFRRYRVENFIEGVKIVRGIQDHLQWNPRAPGTGLAMAFFEEVARRLRVGSRLRMFSSIGTRLDLMGVDCWLEYYGRLVTIDVSTMPSKDDLRADVLLSRSHFVRDRYPVVACRIAEALTW